VSTEQSTPTSTINLMGQTIAELAHAVDYLTRNRLGDDGQTEVTAGLQERVKTLAGENSSMATELWNMHDRVKDRDDLAERLENAEQSRRLAEGLLRNARTERDEALAEAADASTLRDQVRSLQADLGVVTAHRDQLRTRSDRAVDAISRSLDQRNGPTITLGELRKMLRS
jgi:hypothetical protein